MKITWNKVCLMTQIGYGVVRELKADPTKQRHLQLPPNFSVESLGTFKFAPESFRVCFGQSSRSLDV